MRDRLDDFGSASVAGVTFAEQADLASHKAQLAVPFPMLADPARDLYRRFELGRGSIREVYGIGTLKLYAALLRRGRKLRRPAHDTRQLGGDFVIDRSGVLAAGYWQRSPDDRPTIDQLVEAVDHAR